MDRDYRQTVYSVYVTQKTTQSGYTYSEADYTLWARATYARVKDWLPSDKNGPILDVGCGPGNFLFLLQQHGYTELTGVDLSGEQLELARRHCPKAMLLQRDVHEVLSERVNYYNLIAGFDIIEHFEKQEVLPLLSLIARALQPGGRVILQTPNADSPWFGPVAYGDFTHEWFYTPQSLADVLRIAGFSGYAARPSGPYSHGVKSAVRRGLWEAIRALLAVWNLAEVGHKGSGIYTRVFIATAVKSDRLKV